MEKRIVIREFEGQLVIDVLQDGYNIIEHTIYDAEELARPLLEYIEQEQAERKELLKNIPY